MRSQSTALPVLTFALDGGARSVSWACQFTHSDRASATRPTGGWMSARAGLDTQLQLSNVSFNSSLLNITRPNVLSRETFSKIWISSDEISLTPVRGNNSNGLFHSVFYQMCSCHVYHSYFILNNILLKF
jgi:hypothetical protein